MSSKKPDEKPKGKPEPTRERVFLRALEIMLEAIDQRLPDDSMAPKPYEVTQTEMRDFMRIAKMRSPITNVGSYAIGTARREALEGKL
jgi:hypothetical protein